ncbi:MAG: tRNA uridine-5-carboxymethylaminomethyl(34) synthesis GTPase MnmE [Proteobacteria bacterium]|nr:tRNA uridine-5-carboxymethylaminomethyl(34) synthesis GTPase MnmE [Pseudomonadota bacterium]
MSTPIETSDTIAAISTPVGQGAIGIVRITGPTAFGLAEKVFALRGAGVENRVERYLYYGSVHSCDGVKIDDGFIVYMSGPNSYTGEDTVELFCHGGLLVTARVLETVLAAGARIAEPGEFTRRAFMNGKLDLAQAEAVIDVIKASTDGALRSARARLGGTLSKRINSIKDGLVDLRVRIEATLDFPEDISPELLEKGRSKEETDPLVAELATVVADAEGALQRLLATYDEGRLLREGLRVLILGRPNVGKSSLLNLLLQEERAIVTHLPGTTRDLIEEPLNIRSIPVRLIDTAGLRETADLVESIGIEAARAQIESADMVLFVVDLTDSDFTEDRKIVESIEADKILIVANKKDSADIEAHARLEKTFSDMGRVAVSALGFSNDTANNEKDGSGIVELEEALFTLATGHAPGSAQGADQTSEMITSVRHKRSLEGALVALERARAAAVGRVPLELVATDLLLATNSLGEVTGAVTTDDILSKIFSEFCIGK